jgi:uncharacterized protein (TIGR03067 family)
MLSNQWMRIRNNVFDDRSWFARSAADLEPLSATGPPSAEISLAKPAPPRAIAPADVSSAPELEGRWRVKELSGNGKPIHDPEQSGALWTFAGNELSISSPAGSSTLYTVTPIRDARGMALWLQARGPAAGGAEKGWMIYELGHGTLKIAFHDGLGDRPESFEPPAPKSEPLLVTVLLTR